MKKATSQQLAHIPLAKIEPSNYQRPINTARVDSIVQNFDEAKLGTLTVSRRDGRYIAVDGQHRLMALRALDYTHAVCLILTDLTPQDEAKYFRNQDQDKRPLRPLDFFKAGLIEKDEKCIKINEIVGANSFKIGFATNDFFHIGAIQALFTIVDDYGYDILDSTLSLIAAIWLETPKATRGECLLGVAEFVSRYTINVADLDDHLRTRFLPVWYEYKQVVGRAQQSQKARNHFCRILVKHYNKGFGGNSSKRLKWID